MTNFIRTSHLLFTLSLSSWTVGAERLNFGVLTNVGEFLIFSSSLDDAFQIPQVSASPMSLAPQRACHQLGLSLNSPPQSLLPTPVKAHMAVLRLCTLGK